MKNLIVVDRERELIEAFRARDQKYVEIPSRARFPLTFENYLTWSEPTGQHQYLVFRKPVTRELAGIVFDRGDAGRHRGITQMCQWCQASGPSDEIDMLTVSVSSRVIVGVVLCIDLSCIDKLQTTGQYSKKTFDQLVDELLTRINRFHERKIAARRQILNHEI